MARYLILLNKNPLYKIFKNHASELILLDYESALDYIEKAKDNNPEGEYEMISEVDYYKQLEKVLMDKDIVKMPEFKIEDILEAHKPRMEYYDNNINGFSLPIVVDKDNDYAKRLIEVLENYYDYMNGKIAFNDEIDLIKEIRFNTKRIIGAVESYFSGDIGNAKKLIKKVLKQYELDDKNFFVSELDKSYAFRGAAPFRDLHANNYVDTYKKMNEEPLSFYKARKGRVEERIDMLHIPFDKRGLIASQRFSIAGVPCIYLGTTSYVCWNELGKPDSKDFNVCAYRFNEKGKKLRVLNLVISEPLINGVFNRGLQNEESTEKKLQIEMLKIFPLVIATSFTVLEEGRSFKSEYVIPQLIMHCLKELNIDGVAYLSKKGKDDFQYPHGVNLALPVFERNKYEKYGAICDCFELSEPINYGSFSSEKNLDNGETSYINTIYKKFHEVGGENFMAKVNYNDRMTFYGNIKFAHFDNYLLNIERKTY